MKTGIIQERSNSRFSGFSCGSGGYGAVIEAVSDEKLVPRIEQIYSCERIIEIAGKNWTDLKKKGLRADSLEIRTGRKDIYELLSSGRLRDLDYLRWRLYRGADIAASLSIPKIVLSFPSRKSPEKNGKWSSAALLFLLEEIIRYDAQSTFVLALEESFPKSGFGPETERELSFFVRTGRLKVVVIPNC